MNKYVIIKLTAPLISKSVSKESTLVALACGGGSSTMSNVLLRERIDVLLAPLMVPAELPSSERLDFKLQHMIL